MLPRMIDAPVFSMPTLLANAPMVAVENPLVYKAARAIIGEPDCIVNPYHFGDMYLKRTCWFAADCLR